MSVSPVSLSFEYISGKYVADIDADNRILIEPDFDPMPPSDWTDNPSEEDMELYRNGEVYGIIRERKCDKCGSWEVINSCWGFYGLAYAEESALDFVDAE